MTEIAILLIGAGATFLVIAAWGVLTLGDALSRQHAATKAGTLALAFALVGAWLLVPSFEWALRLALILGFLMATLPIASHLLARAAAAEPGLEAEIRDAPLVGDEPRCLARHEGADLVAESAEHSQIPQASDLAGSAAS